MMFDAQVTAMGVEVLVPEPDLDGQMPADQPLSLAITLASLLQTPQGVIPMQMGVIRVPMSAKSARKVGEQLIEAADLMPEPKAPSGLVVASSADVDAIAKQAAAVDGLKGK